MAFSNTVLKAGIKSDGTAYEYGTWNGAAVTTGTITAGSGTGFVSGTPKVGLVMNWAASSNADTAVTPARDVSDTTLKLTFSSGDAGHYYIEGPSSGS